MKYEAFGQDFINLCNKHKVRALCTICDDLPTACEMEFAQINDNKVVCYELYRLPQAIMIKDLEWCNRPVFKIDNELCVATDLFDSKGIKAVHNKAVLSFMKILEL